MKAAHAAFVAVFCAAALMIGSGAGVPLADPKPGTTHHASADALALMSASQRRGMSRAQLHGLCMVHHVQQQKLSAPKAYQSCLRIVSGYGLPP